jgi:hypothetical protein
MSRRLPLIFVAVITVIGVVVAGVAIAASGVSGSSVGYAVNGTEVSQATVDHQLKEIADSDAKSAVETLFGTTVSTTKGAVSSTVTATWLNLQIRRELYRQAAAKAKTKVGAAERAAQRSVIDQSLAGNNAKFRLADLPRAIQVALVDDFAYPVALGLDSDAALGTFVQRALRRADVSVDPRYGTWNPRQGVCAPTGCGTSAGG